MEPEILNLVHIVQMDAFGVSSFHAHCPACDWQCHRQPHGSIATAIRCGERHNDKH